MPETLIDQGFGLDIVGRGRFGDRGRFFVSFSRKGDKEPSPVSKPPPVPNLSPTALYAYVLAILNAFAHNRHCCVMGIRLYLCEQNNASIYAANTMERENNHEKI